MKSDFVRNGIRLALWREPVVFGASIRGRFTASLILGLIALFVALVSLGPLLRLAVEAVAPRGILDLEHLAQVLATPQVLRASLDTLEIAAGSTVLAVVMGTAAAFAVGLTDAPLGRAFVFGLILVLMAPPQVTTLAWIEAASPANPVAALLGLQIPAGASDALFSAGGIILLLGFYHAPIVFMSVRASLRAVPADLVEAARLTGSSASSAVRAIVLPLAVPGILSGAALAFVGATGNFGIQALLGIPAHFPTLITLVYQRMNTLGPSALPDLAALSLFLALVTVASLAVQSLLARGRDTRVARGRRLRKFRIGRWRWPLALLLWAFLVLMLVTPLSALIATSLVRGYGQALTAATATLQNYRDVLFAHTAVREALGTSAALACVAALVLFATSVPLAYFIARRRGPLARLIGLSIDLTYALPGIVLGLAAILFFLRPLPVVGISIYGTFWIVLVVYFAHFFALALHPLVGGFRQIQPAQEEAAQMGGAGFLRRLIDILAPLVAAPAGAGAILVFLGALGEIQVSILLVSSSVKTVGTQILFLEEGGSQGLAAAVSCLVLLAVLFTMALASLLRRRLPEGVLPWD